jgi:hypothetical protein
VDGRLRSVFLSRGKWRCPYQRTRQQRH